MADSAARAGSVPLASIVGAPRCGTTSLSRMLEMHPDVCFSSVKEPHFFSLHDLAGCADDELREIVDREYLGRYFAHCDGTPALLAEGSVSYLYGPETMGPVLRLWPGARFIIAVRDPMEMLPSLHQRHLYQGDETEPDFAAAWRLCSERAQGRSIPRTCLDPRLLRYDEVARFGHYVERFFAAVGRERCLVIVHDDLAADPAAVFRRMLAFLGLPDVPFEGLPPQRPGKSFRFAWLQRLLKRPPVVTRAVLAGEKFRQRVVAAAAKPPSPAARAVMEVRRRLLRWNEVPMRRRPVPENVRAEIRDHLEADVALLEKLIGRDLQHWLGGLRRAA